MKPLVPFLLLAVIPFAGCDVPVEDADISYTERIVVQGVLEPGKPVANIYVGRTLPLTMLPDQRAAALTDAEVTVLHNGLAHSLVHSSLGLYADSSLIVVSGDVYEFRARWGGHEALSRTVVPFPVALDSFRFIPDVASGNVGRLDVAGIPRTSEAYGLKWSMGLQRDSGDYNPFSGNYLVRLVRGRDAVQSNAPFLSEEGYLYRRAGPGDTLQIVVFAFDEPFFEYSRSLSESAGNTDLALDTYFPSVRWNVTGDGIGMFIGRTISRRTVVLE